MFTTSEYFRANLGALDCTAVGWLETWSQRTYEQCLIEKSPSGEYVLTAFCRQPKSRKSILMGIRTASSNAGFQLSLRGDDLQLLSGAEYEQVASPELNDNFEELLELWQELQAKHANGAANHRLEGQGVVVCCA